MTERWIPEDALYAQWLTKADGTVLAHVAEDESGSWSAFYPMFNHALTMPTRQAAQAEVERLLNIQREKRAEYFQPSLLDPKESNL